MDAKTLVEFFDKCYELGVSASDCADLAAVIEPNIAKRIEGLSLWMAQHDI